MITCSYCATEVELITGGSHQDHAYCAYCEVFLGPNSEHGMYAKDGERIPHVKQKGLITEDHVKLPLSKLKELHTIDLLLCLSIARKHRGDWYNQMRIFNRASEQAREQEEITQWKSAANETGGDYEYWTRRCWMIENLLIERLGYFPEKINDELYIKFMRHNERSMKKNMVISKQKKEKQNSDYVG
ncbi:MAG: hypothetical protein Q8934_08845 [Bacillota bacterium]|nr:hypothetical protein [Bacillota bacterium]